MKEEDIYDPTLTPRLSVVRRISWPAIFAGLIITLVSEVVLSVLGVSIGVTAVNPLTADQSTAQGFGIGAAIWILVISIISLFLGGWVAGRMSGLVRGSEGALHGLLTWGVTTLLTVYLFSSAVGGMLSGAGSMMTSAAPSASSGGGNNAQGGLGGALQGMAGGGSDSVRQEIQTMSQGNPQLATAAARLISEGSNASPEDRRAVVSMLMTQKNMSEDQANQTVDRWIQTSQQVKGQTEQKARQVGQKAARGASLAAWGSFIILVLSALAAAWGGSRGAIAYLRSRPEIATQATA